MGNEPKRSELEWLACHRIDEGRLPGEVVRDVVAGYGHGERCQLCDLPVAAQAIAYEVTDGRTRRSITFHIACYQAWQLECLARSKAKGPQRDEDAANPGSDSDRIAG